MLPSSFLNFTILSQKKEANFTTHTQTMDMELIYSSLALLLSIFFMIKIFNLYKPKKNLPPSPPSIPILGHLHLLSPPFHRSFHALSTRYGPVISLKLGRQPLLVVSSPTAAEECFTKNDVIFANRPNLLVGQLGYNFSVLVWAPYGPHWRNLRKVTAILALSGKRIDEAGPIRKDEIQYMIRNLIRSSEMGSGKANLSELFEQYAKNIVMRLVNGKRWEPGFDPPSPTAINVIDFVPVLKWVGYKGIEKEMRSEHKERDKFLQGLINEFREKRKRRENCLDERKSIVEELLDLQKEDPEYYSDNILKGVIAVMLLAGSHTSGRTIEWAMSLLFNHPEILKKARSQIDVEVGTKRLVNDADLPKLPYIRCIVNETLRLFPPAPILLPHYSSQDCTIGGYHVEKGTILFVNVWAMHRDPELWDDPTKFIPERFEKEKEGFKFMPFGIGKRTCPGNNFALRNVTLALATLIQCFDWKAAEDGLVDLTEYATSIVVPKEKPLEAICCPRSSMVGVISQI